MVEEYPEHDMPGEFLVSLSHNLLDVTTEDIKQFDHYTHPAQTLILHVQR
jgi:hypothetical protein